MLNERRLKLSKSILIHLTLLFFAYAVAKMLFYKNSPGDIYFLFKTMFWIAILLLVGFFKSLDFTWNKDKFLIFLLWTLSIISLKQIGWFAENVWGSIVIYSSSIALIWLLKANSYFFSKLALIFIIFTAVLSRNHNVTAETFAELTFLWLGTSIIIRLKENF